MTDDAETFEWPPAEHHDDPVGGVAPRAASGTAPHIVHDDVRKDLREDVRDDVFDHILDEVPGNASEDAMGDLPIAIAPVPPPLMQQSAERLERPQDEGAWAQSSRTASWTVAAALCVGLACGFGGGYLVGGGVRPFGRAWRAAPPSVSLPVPPRAPSPSARDYTEGAINDSLKDPVRDPAPDTGSDSGGVLRQPESSAATGRLLVRSTPADAQVFVDGLERGRTPATIRGLARGPHRLQVVREGYIAEDRSVVITAERPAESVSLDLERPHPETASTARTDARQGAVDGTLAGALDVESRPPDAQVFLDGMLVGTTPFASARVGPGQHLIRLERNGYRRWLASVWIVRGERSRITASLEQ
jgi:hypothetical protein